MKPKSLSEMRDELAHAYGTKKAMPEIRSMYPMESRGVMAMEFGYAYREGWTACQAELLKRAERLVSALEVYEMTNETFPGYGDVARKVLREWKEGMGI